MDAVENAKGGAGQTNPARTSSLQTERGKIQKNKSQDAKMCFCAAPAREMQVCVIHTVAMFYGSSYAIETMSNCLHLGKWGYKMHYWERVTKS